MDGRTKGGLTSRNEGGQNGERRGEGGDTVKLPLDRIFMAQPTEIDRADEHAAPSLGQIDSHPGFESCHVCWEYLRDILRKYVKCKALELGFLRLFCHLT